MCDNLSSKLLFFLKNDLYTTQLLPYHSRMHLARNIFQQPLTLVQLLALQHEKLYDK